MAPRAAILATVAAAGLAIAAATQHATAASQRSALADLEAEQTALFARTAPAVIYIGDDDSLGTGFLVSPTGLALTAAHVVGKATKVKVVLHGGKRTTATVLHAAPEVDLALLQVAVDDKAGALPFLPLATTVDLEVGQWAGAIGHGLGGVWAFTTGMISNLYEADHGAEMVQTQIPLNPGNSGGPIFDRTGRAVAVVSRGAKAGNSINLAIHVADAFMVFDELLPSCDCLAIDVGRDGVPVFLDDVAVGRGPRVLVRPSAGTHTVSTVVDGKSVERTIDYPRERRAGLD